MAVQSQQEREFIEEFALFFESQGLPRMMGRMLAWLLICDPPVQSSQQLAEALSASKGSISTTTRQLVQMGLVQKVGKPGERGLFFTVEAQGWTKMLESNQARVTAFRRLADRGLELVDARGADRGAALRDIRDFYAFMEREFPALLEQYLASRGRKP